MYCASGVSSCCQLGLIRWTYKDECFSSFCPDSVKVIGNQYGPSKFTRYDGIRRVGREVLYRLRSELVSKVADQVQELTSS